LSWWTTRTPADHVLCLTTLVSADDANVPTSPRLHWKVHEPTRRTLQHAARR